MSQDVSRFLEEVRELGDGRVEEDAARERELEERILQERRERQARRAERARSISPQKSSPVNTPSPSAAFRLSGHKLSASPGVSIPPPVASSASLQSITLSSRDDDADFNMDVFGGRRSGSQSPTKDPSSQYDGDDTRQPGQYSSTSASAGIARGPTLPWQQRRPPSQAGDRPRSRPLSMVAAENAASRKSSDQSDAQQLPPSPTKSRDQIAAALSSKDPTWFRQTPDRGATSAAYRRNQVEDDDLTDMPTGRAQLPGMTREPSIQQTEPAKPEGRTPSDALHRRLGSPLSMPASARLDPPNVGSPPDREISPERSTYGAASGGRVSPTRPVSPTKGLGGFVESAMMKRTDSVKRWSVTTPAGLSRGGTVTGNKTGYDPIARGHTPKTSSLSRPTSHSRDGSLEPDTKNPSSAKDGLSLATGDRNVEAPTEQGDRNSPPVSPSKTMDPRRWSPTKSSWLEAALNKPESPKPKPVPAASTQPSWMQELNRAKKSGSTADPPKSTTAAPKHEVAIGGLLRSGPPGVPAKPPKAPLGVYPSAGTTTPAHGLLTAVPRGVAPPTSADTPSADPFFARRSANEGGTPVTKPRKPETPPKKAELGPKPTAASNAESQQQSSEFQNVFGNLRRTKTQNYVAPDTFTDNIKRGKAALNVTGGPKKSERRDELKDAILKKKEDFKKAQADGKGVVTRKGGDPTAEKPVPEGLAKRMEMAGKTGGAPSALLRTKTGDAATFDLPSRPLGTSAPLGAGSGNLAKSSATISKPKSYEPEASPLPPKRDSASSSSAAVSSWLSKKPEPERTGSLPLPGLSKATPQTAKDSPSASGPLVDPPMEPLHKEQSAPGRLQGKLGGTLASRFNPALAGMLARGPPGASKPGPTGVRPAASEEQDSRPAPQLTHMTKNRARGPKRKAPSTLAVTPSPAPTDELVAEPQPTPSKESRAPAIAEKSPTAAAWKPHQADLGGTPKKPETTQADKPTPGPKVISLVDSSKRLGSETPVRTGDVISLVDSSKTNSRPLPEPRGQPIDFGAPSRTNPSVWKSEKPSPVGSPIVKSHETFGKAPGSPEREQEADQATSQPPSPKKLVLKRISRFFEDQSGQVSDTKATEDISTQQSGGGSTIVKLRSRSRSPTKSAFENAYQPATLGSGGIPATGDVTSDKVDSAPVVSVRNGASMFGGAAPSSRSTSQEQEGMAGTGSAKTPRPISQVRIPTSPDAGRNQSGRPSSRPASPVRSPTKQALEVSALLDEFFGASRPKRVYNMDTADILARRPENDAPRISTAQVQMFQLLGDGKKRAVPQHSHRDLFEADMYLCAHTFTPREGGRKTTEVYLWVGDEVPEAQAEDAQLFASREARSLGGRLVRMRQGRETAEFVAALGGIVIVRRGSSSRYDSLAAGMLCGRRHLGQIAFDEVAFSPASLCSGFPFLITRRGRCHLWKGKGAGVDELGCARLVGMDLTLTGEIDEVDDGMEPAGFWDVFGGGEKGPSADHWRLKPTYDKYCVRLFRAEEGGAQQIVEMHPFAQTDLSPSDIYVLDAFFELYIVVGARSQRRVAAFAVALDFAQEYAILAAGVEDRPFVPISTVVLEGVPRDLKSVFRKWRDELAPTSPPGTIGRTVGGGGGGGLRRARSLKIVPLNQALLALKD